MFGRVIAVGVSQRGLRLVTGEIRLWAGVFLFRDGLRCDLVDLILDPGLFCNDWHGLVQAVLTDGFAWYNTGLLKQVGVFV